ncbi:hypothetical protein BAJUN_02360 [Bajunvirus bajun]|uniref:Uncharacterized protein n=1 Tax=Brevundimonas phage vB_BgoS-Bajun TaxID=2948594 RepID=A0A9E7N7V0_9CAUD|nr:hypothetical protein BAJUN_02360 [Brevundimonas phage vB_BgoS-Bajun]
MPLKNARSDTPGARANLLPGEVKHQRADDLLLIRGNGNRKLEIDLERWRSDAAPADGVSGAPLLRSGSGVSWDASLAPSCEVNGHTTVDAAPAAYGVPGLMITGLGTPLDVQSGRVLVETFYLASDTIHVVDLAINVTENPGPPVRFGLVDSTGEIIFEQRLSNTVLGRNAVAVNMDITYGTYHLMIWCGSSFQMSQVQGVRIEQGMTFDERTPQFLRRRQTASPMGTALAYHGIEFNDVLSATPGEDHAILMSWELTT